MQSAHAACIEIGATTAAAFILRHLDALAQQPDAHNDKRDLTVSALEMRLADAADDMDELIAQFAANILSKSN